VRIFHGVSTKEAKETVDALVERKTPLIWEIGSVKRDLDLELKTKDQVLLLLHHHAGWASVGNLLKWVEYSNPSTFRWSILVELHKARLIEFDGGNDRAHISPKGAKDVENRLLKPTDPTP
jgi:hypothetical protein